MTDNMRSTPDWGVIPSRNPVNVDIDAAELAVRLGSSYIHTRTGRVVFYDPFSFYNWDTINGTPAIVSAVSRQGETSLRLQMDPGNSQGLIRKRVSFEYGNIGGYEICFGWLGNALLDTAYFEVSYLETSLIPNTHLPTISVDFSIGQVRFLQPGGVWGIVPGIVPAWGPVHPSVVWHTLKFTWDYELHEYREFSLDHFYYRFPAGVLVDDNNLVGAVEDEISITNWFIANNLNMVIYLQSAILTTNEPEG